MRNIVGSLLFSAPDTPATGGSTPGPEAEQQSPEDLSVALALGGEEDAPVVSPESGAESEAEGGGTQDEPGEPEAQEAVADAGSEWRRRIEAAKQRLKSSKQGSSEPAQKAPSNPLDALAAAGYTLDDVVAHLAGVHDPQPAQAPSEIEAIAAAVAETRRAVEEIRGGSRASAERSLSAVVDQFADDFPAVAAFSDQAIPEILDAAEQIARVTGRRPDLEDLLAVANEQYMPRFSRVERVVKRGRPVARPDAADQAAAGRQSKVLPRKAGGAPGAPRQPTIQDMMDESIRIALEG